MLLHLDHKDLGQIAVGQVIAEHKSEGHDPRQNKRIKVVSDMKQSKFIKLVTRLVLTL